MPQEYTRISFQRPSRLREASSLAAILAIDAVFLGVNVGLASYTRLDAIAAEHGFNAMVHEVNALESEHVSVTAKDVFHAYRDAPVIGNADIYFSAAEKANDLVKTGSLIFLFAGATYLGSVVLKRR